MWREEQRAAYGQPRRGSIDANLKDRPERETTRRKTNYGGGGGGGRKGSGGAGVGALLEADEEDEEAAEAGGEVREQVDEAAATSAAGTLRLLKNFSPSEAKPRLRRVSFVFRSPPLRLLFEGELAASPSSVPARRPVLTTTTSMDHCAT